MSGEVGPTSWPDIRSSKAQLYPQAAQDLAQAAQSGFSLVDYAVFYQASALSQANRARGRRRCASGFRRALSRQPLAI